MKKNLLFSLFIFVSIIASAQVNKFALLEHYTNTKCPSCGANNPGFYNKSLSYFYKNIHHISYHPSFPYNTCVLYKANTTENDARAAYNGAISTPSYIINGKGGTKAASTLTVNELETQKASKSPIEVKVKEISGVSGWTANIKIKNHGTLSGSNYVLMAALCEKTLNYNAPNGEKVHYDVFRKMLTNVKGNSIAIPTTGNETEVNFNYTMNADWNANEIYVVAWLVDASTQEVINSGSKFTTVTVNNEDLIEDENINIYPNPASDFLNIDLNDNVLKINKYQIFNNLGQIVQEAVIDNSFSTIDIANLPKSQYLLKLISKEGAVVRAFVKQ